MLSGSRKALIAVATALATSACTGGDEAAGAEGDNAAFLAENARQEGVETLPSGVQYRVVRTGSPNGAQPDSNDLVSVHYEGQLRDGTVFDSSYQRGVPAAMPLDRLIPAWQEAIPMMRVGDEWTLWVPPEQGYGDQGGGPIPPNSVLVFRIELLDVAPVPGGETNRAAG